MRPRLIPEWRRAHRLASVRAAALLLLLGLLETLRAEFLPAIQPLVPEAWWPAVAAGFGFLIAVLRVVQQLHALTQQADQAEPPSEPTP